MNFPGTNGSHHALRHQQNIDFAEAQADRCLAKPIRRIEAAERGVRDWAERYEVRVPERHPNSCAGSSAIAWVDPAQATLMSMAFGLAFSSFVR